MRVGIVGCGGMGAVHTSKYLLMRDVEISVFDLDEPKLSAFCEARSVTACHSLESLLETCDAVDICLPTTLHKSVAIQALQAGKPTLVEKPMARTPDECKEMMEAARTSGATLIPAHVVRFFPEHRKAAHAIREGKIGQPASVRLRRGGGAPKADWFLDRAASGGILLDLAIHEFDWLLWTVGPAKSVTARTVQHQGAKVRGDYALTTIKFDNGCVAHVESTWLDPGGFRATIEASGSEGMIEFDSRINPTLRVAGATNAVENNYDPSDDPYFLQLRSFVNVALEREVPAVTMEEGFSAVQVACAAIESAESAKTVYLY